MYQKFSAKLLLLKSLAKQLPPQQIDGQQYHTQSVLSRLSLAAISGQYQCHHQQQQRRHQTVDTKTNGQSSASQSMVYNEERPQFPGSRSQWTQELRFVDPDSYPGIPVYRVVDKSGQPVVDDLKQLNQSIDKPFLIRLYRGMVKLNQMDTILYNAQRQGRISFYITSHGEEATHFGPAAALEDTDLVYGQYREPGVLMWRGFRTEDFLDQCFGNRNDLGKGRQMPIHYGSRALNFVTIKSTLTSQMVHSVGSAYAYKRQQNGRVVMCYFGDGAASEGDAHAALNFAATLDCPIIFFCRNNGFAISTPTHEQYRGDGIAARGPALGIPAIRIDGNDIIANYLATLEARRICLEDSRPVLIEAMTYRVSHHSTSDDSSAYRSVDEVRNWQQSDHPILRLKRLLQLKGWYAEDEENQYKDDVRKEIMSALVKSEKVPKPSIRSLFTDVYSCPDEQLPEHLDGQYQQLVGHLKAYKQHYPIELFEADEETTPDANK
ncbi:2-oxoisovalerate dehydrogenase subunit alpha, mitochondrial-like [Oppia nitens]|uniref:2-oxoisovalerate dehydrogenase subunit alpha, mitochondrial-like n=1 Tax=Oppia nitens TaxID=1686743 RepID=UPI0023DC574B|nr:2-oxoisovalerate dehydrogenase subunit alpha, mitochondrial-like [Oppia nitens]